MNKQQVFALDFDDTFTADPEFWSDFVIRSQARGHVVICISACRDTFQNRRKREEQLPSGVKIYCSYDKPKIQFADERNLGVTVWIDDCPEMIVGYARPQ